MFISFFIIIILNYINSNLILSFEEKNIFNNNLDYNNYFEYLFGIELISNIYLGNNKQKLIINFTFNFSEFLISKNFNYENSKTFNFINEKEFNFEFIDTIYNCIYSKDNIIINNKNINNFPFLYVKNSNKNYDLNIVGLNIFNENNNKYNLIYNLKKLKKIDSCSFYFDFDDKKLIIGKFFEEKKLKYEKIFNNERLILIFDEAFLENKMIMKEKFKIEFNINFEGFLGNFEYFYTLNSTYFNNYYKNNICYISKIDSLYGIICDNKINKKNFPKLIFNHKILQKKFEFDFNDLFIEKNNKFYFKIFFNDFIINSEWIVGRTFLKKYKIIFDLDKQIIAIENNKKKSINNLKKLFFFLLFCSFILFLILLKMYKNNPYIFKSKKYLKYYLMNEYKLNNIYEEKNNNNNKNIIK